MKFWSKSEQYIYDERLAILGVVDKPTPAQDGLAMEDVERFRRDRVDKKPVKKKGME
jgi:hypothetical protein